MLFSSGIWLYEMDEEGNPTAEEEVIQLVRNPNLLSYENPAKRQKPKGSFMASVIHRLHLVEL